MSIEEEIARTLSPLLNRVRAEALREAARGMDVSSMDPWVWLQEAADRIEQGDEFMGGPSEAARQHLQEWRATRERLFVDHLANEIRRVDGRHSLGAGALAEALLPFLAEHDRQVAERAWDAAVEETHALGWLHDFAKLDALARNPYRAAKGEQK